MTQADAHEGGRRDERSTAGVAPAAPQTHASEQAFVADRFTGRRYPPMFLAANALRTVGTAATIIWRRLSSLSS